MADDFSIGSVGRSGVGQALLDQLPPDIKSELGTDFDPDTFLKKVGPWAFYSFFLSTQNDVEETLGRFSVQPVDALVMTYLEASVAPSNRLPTGHLYDSSLTDLLNRCGEALNSDIAEEAADALELLDRDTQLRDYLQTRRLEYFLS